MIRFLGIDNFKSLVGFELYLSEFTCLIGLNGAGKSSVLQALDFTSAVMSGNVTEWLDKRNWKAKDLNSKLINKSNIRVSIALEVDEELYMWTGNFNRAKLSCTAEILSIITEGREKDILIVKGNGQYTLYENDPAPITFQYEGSILSQLKSSVLGDEIEAIKKGICDIRSLDLLSPQSLRLRARKSDKGDIGMGGEQLSLFIHRLDDAQKASLVEKLQAYYPQVKNINTKALRSGWIQLELTEEYTNADGEVRDLKTEARHINDGMLRLLAILAQQFSPLETLLFDEIENGINPEITEKVVDALVTSPKQIIVTTHSPMVLNYMDDEVAKKAVTLIYKRDDGHTHAIPFFDVPSAAEKLESLAPGDAMLDVYLQDIAKEAEILRQESPQKEV